MKRRVLCLVLGAFLLMALFAGCGGGAIDSAFNGAAGKSAASMPMTAAVSLNESYYDYADYGADEPAEYYGYASSGGSGMVQYATDETGEGDGARAETYDKIIYSGSANVETVHFDETVEQVYQLISRYGGFLESSYVTGRDYSSEYYNRYSYRNAEFVIRVPRESFNAIRGELDSLGSVTYFSVEAQNITSAYRDTESRLSTYRVEEERLLDMLKKAEYVEDMLNIEDRLASVRYQIESLTTTLINWDSKINYSTLRLSVQEVKELTEEKPIARTFGDDLWAGVRDSLEWLGEAGKDIVIFIASAIPLLIIPAVIVIAVILIIRSHRRKKRKNAALRETNDVKDDN